MLVSKLLRNLSSNYVTAACSAVVALFLTPLLFNYLQPSRYGVLVFAIAAEALLETVDFGIMTAMIRFVSIKQATGQLLELRELVSTLFFVAAGMGAASAALLAGGSSWIVSLSAVHGSGLSAKTVALVIAVIGVSCLVELPGTVLRGFLQGLQDFHLSNAVEASAVLMRAAWMLAAMHEGYGLVGIALAFPAAALYRLGAMLLVARRAEVPFTPQWSLCRRARLAELKEFAAWTFADENVRLWFAQADVFIATRVLPIAEVGLLSIGRRIPGFIQRCTNQTAVVGFPIVSGAAARGVEAQGALQRFAIVTARNTFAFFVPVGAVLMVWAPDLLRLWIGPAAVPAAPVLRIFILFALLAGLTDHVTNLLYATDQPRSAAVIAAGQLVGGVPLAFWAARHFGIAGIAAAFVVVELLAAVFLFRMALRKIELSVGRFLRAALLPVLLAALPSATAVPFTYLVLPHNPLGLLTSSACALILFLFFFGLVVTGWESQPIRSRLRHLLVEV